MRIRKKARRVRLDLANIEASPGIQSIRPIQARSKRTRHVPHSNTLRLIANWVREREARWPRGAASSFVEVCCGAGRRLVCAGDVLECDALGVCQLCSSTARGREGRLT